MVANQIHNTNSTATDHGIAMATPSGNTQQVKLNEAINAGHSLMTLAVPDGDVRLTIG